MAAEQFDLIVVGSGPAGYTGAIRASQLGMKVACVEKDKTYGGTCLNVGCIPSKALLESSEHFLQAKTKFAKHGIVLSGIQLDLPSMMKRKEGVVRQLTTGIAGLFKKNKIEGIMGLGAFKGRVGDQIQMEVDHAGAKRLIQAPKVMIATGSTPAQLPFLPFDGDRVVSSTEALSFPEVPKHLVVVGGGVIGLELGSVWARSRRPGNRNRVRRSHSARSSISRSAKSFTSPFKSRAWNSVLRPSARGQPARAIRWSFRLEEIATGTKSQIECDRVLVATGRKPNTQGLGLDAIGLATDKLGRIEIDSHFQTKVPGVYAVGDVVAGPMLAHKAEEEAVAAVEIMAGQAGHVNYDAIPNVIYTWPELASVGMTEEEVKAKGIAYKVGTFPFMANGRAKSMEETEGLAKIIADSNTDRVLGVHIVGPRASDMIPEAVTTMEFGGSAEDIARTCHAHPTLSEVLKQAALGVDKRTIEM